MNDAKPASGDGLLATRDAWFAVCDALDQVDPDWMMHGPVGVEAAVATIRRLATPEQPKCPECDKWLTGYCNSCAAKLDEQPGSSVQGEAEIRWVIGDQIYSPPTGMDALEYANDHIYPDSKTDVRLPKLSRLRELFTIPPPAPAAEQGKREADRRRFPDPDFNAWLDQGISDCGHTVWDAVGDVQAAWQGWEAAILAQPEAPAAEAKVIRLTSAEIQSGVDRVRWAEGLIRQLPADHDGRNSWLINYGTSAGLVAAAEQGEECQHVWQADKDAEGWSYCPKCDCSRRLPATQPEARGVEGMDCLQGHVGTIVGWWRDGDFLWATADDNVSELMDKGWVPVTPVPPSAAYALPEATPNPVRAEQPDTEGVPFCPRCGAHPDEGSVLYTLAESLIVQSMERDRVMFSGADALRFGKALRAMLAAAPASPGVRVDDVFMVPKVPSQEWLDTFANRLGIDSADAQNILAALAPDGGEGE